MTRITSPCHALYITLRSVSNPYSSLLSMVSAKLVYRFHFLALCWLACFSNTRFMPVFASRVATAPIPVSLWLGSRIVGRKYLWIVLILKNTTSEEQWSHSAIFTVMVHKARNIHYRYFSWTGQQTFKVPFRYRPNAASGRWGCRCDPVFCWHELKRWLCMTVMLWPWLLSFNCLARHPANCSTAVLRYSVEI